MSTLKINKGHLPEIVNVPPSKSYANRALILAAVKKSSVQIKRLPQATDVTHLVSALKEIGLQIEGEDSLTIKNSFPQCESGDKEIYVGEGGTTARFLAALLLHGTKRYTLKLGKRLKERPWQEFLDLANVMGAKAELNGDQLVIQGPVSVPATLDVDCSRTTQFATAFELIFDNCEIIPNNLISSESYWKMNAPLKEHFQKSDSYTVPLDWSSAAFPIVFGALNHQMSLPGLQVDYLQADSRIIDVLNTIGFVTTLSESIHFFPVAKPSQVILNMQNCLDLFPALSFLVSHIEGTHELSGLENLVHKESDRLKEVCSILTQFERTFELKGNKLLIKGSNKICGEKHLSLPDDHRIVMMAALFLRHHSGGTLDNVESVNKSYPGFFDLMRSP